MDKKNLMPNQAHPISRITAGQLPPELAELAEETLCSHDKGDIVPSSGCLLCFAIGIGGFSGVATGGANRAAGFCAYSGDDVE
ncbi:MAG: microcyclamide/patellamide family RiPP [Leptolyngbya sp. SIO1E4]|nr:microcyclamide/patellamide family RiPP [Leptolyngbya sp. SIO1E4]